MIISLMNRGPKKLNREIKKTLEGNKRKGKEQKKLVKDLDLEETTGIFGAIKKEMGPGLVIHRTPVMEDTKRRRTINNQVGLILTSIFSRIVRRMMIEIEVRNMMIVMTTIVNLAEVHQNLILIITKEQKEMRIVEKDQARDNVETSLTLVSMRRTLSQSLIS